MPDMVEFGIIRDCYLYRRAWAIAGMKRMKRVSETGAEKTLTNFIYSHSR
jgi:hypothetical protein